LNSRRVTFDANEVDHNGGPGIWFDGGASDGVVTANRIHHNNREGVFFEISTGATIANNAVWSNGFGFAEWGYGAGITISSSDRANVHDNTVAWNARGISVISQARELTPHEGNVSHDNVVVSQGGSFVSGWYDDHGGTLFSAASGNSGYGNRYWIGATEPTQDRFTWSGAKTTLTAFDATPGEQGASYLTAADRDAALAAAGIPAADGSVLPGTPPTPTPGPTPLPGTPLPTPSPPPPPPPLSSGSTRPVLASARLEFGTGQMTASASLPGRASWPIATDAVAYQAQVQRNGGSWQSLALSSPTARTAKLPFTGSNRYRVRVRAQGASGLWSSWAYSATGGAVRVQEANPSVTYTGRWALVRREGSSGVYARYSSTADSTVRFHFSGSAVTWIAPRGTGYGTARVYVDGKFRTTVDLRHTATLMRTVAFRTSWASRGTHTIVVQVAGTRRIEVDAFSVLR
jgi:parallel beta helix pectate lyase-like protein